MAEDGLVVSVPDGTRRRRFQAGPARGLVRGRLPGDRQLHRVRRRAPGVEPPASGPGRTSSTSRPAAATSRSCARSGGRTSRGSTSPPSCSTQRAGAPPRRTSSASGSRATRRSCRTPDDSFDRVLSTFGAMFAPRHERAAARAGARDAPRRDDRRRGLDARGRERADVQDRVVAHAAAPAGAEATDACGGTRSTCASCSDRTESIWSSSAANVVFEAESPEAWLEYNSACSARW